MNFDEIIDRTGRGAIKYDWKQKLFGSEEVLPMWVADMEFRSPQCVVEAIKKDLDYGVLGYHSPQKSYYDAVIKWQGEKHDMLLEEEMIAYTPGVVTGLAIAINAFTEEGEGIVVQTPVYFPFFEYPRRNNRKVLYNPLIEKDGQYYMDFDDLEQHFQNGARLFILCSPHNPAGRVWQREELEQLSVLAEQYGVIVLADEIHADLALNGHQVVSYATLSKAAEQHSVTFTAPSKTFNIAGLASSITIIQNPELRQKWVAASEAYELNVGDFLAYSALTAAFEEGEPWRQEMIAYLEGNVAYAMDFFKAHIPAIKAWEPQASFLLWLDCRALGMRDAALMDFFVKKAKLGLSPGIMFGKEGSGFMRMNIAVPRTTLEQALFQLKEAFE